MALGHTYFRGTTEKALDRINSHAYELEVHLL